MIRLIDEQLKEWAKRKNSLPLFLLGARQVGKTYAAKKLANNEFKNKYLYINFLENNDYKKMLNGKTSPKEIIELIEYISKVKITDNFLLILDEIQEIPSLKTSIKNFVEQNINIKIICLGSYLGNMMNNDDYSIPVGKTERMNLYPMNFEEFLLATKNEKYIKEIKDSLVSMKQINQTSHTILLDLLQTYMIIGGMPKAIYEFVNNENYNDEIYKIKDRLFLDYKDDIGKYIESKKDKLKAISIYDNIKIFLAKHNKKFKLSTIDKTARYLNYESAIKNLLITQIIYKIDNIKSFSTPLASNDLESEFKIYYNDCGFVSLVFDLNKNILINDDNNYSLIRGAIAENYIVSEILRKTNNKNLYYYSFNGNENQSCKENYQRDKSNTSYEIDLIQEDINGNIVPIEVKFGKNFETKSLNKIIRENKPKYSIIFSSKNFVYDEKNRTYKIPLYAVSFIDYEKSRLNLQSLKDK